MSFPYQLTLWLWPSGLYPVAVVHYLKAKHLSPAIRDSIALIPVTMSSTGFHQSPTHPPRPANASLPCLQIRNPASGTTDLATQTPSILECLEDMLPATPSLRGASPLEAARVRDILVLWAEVTMCAGTHVKHAQAKTLAWSGMQAEEQSAGAAAEALRDMHRRIAKVEELAARSATAEGAAWIAGTASVSLADCVVAGAVGYFEKNYGLTVLEGLPALTRWYQWYTASPEYATAEEVDALERGESLPWAFVPSG